MTVIDGIVGIGWPEKGGAREKMRSACGCGGTVKDGAIEIQGDQREKMAAILSEADFGRGWRAGEVFGGAEVRAGKAESRLRGWRAGLR